MEKATCVRVRCDNGYAPDWIPDQATTGKWVIKHKDGKTHVISASDYVASEWDEPSEYVAPDWIPDHPTRGRWAFRDVDGERRLIDISQDTGPDDLHFVIGDTIKPVENPADGRIYDSRSQFHAASKALGYEWIGKQEPQSREWKAPGLKQEIIEQVERCKSRDQRREMQNKLARWKETGEMPD